VENSAHDAHASNLSWHSRVNEHPEARQDPGIVIVPL